MTFSQHVAAVSRIATQISGLWLLLLAGQSIAARLPIPLPGNVIGMVLLFLLLTTGLVKESWLQVGAGWLTRHLAFFFVPIAVGLMQWMALLREAGHWLLLVLALSGLLGLVVTGAIAQRLGRRERPEESSRWNTSPSWFSRSPSPSARTPSVAGRS
jgi:holin-like protein